MALPGLFVEYLVIGALALLWVLPVTGIEFGGAELVVLKIAALAPAIYVLGMFVDFLAFGLVTWFPRRNGSYKARVRRIVESKKDLAVESTTSISPEAPDALSHLAEQGWLANYSEVFWGGFAELESNAPGYTGSTARRQIRLVVEKPEIARQVDMRSSLDRIARGAVVNLALIGIVNAASFPVLSFACLVLAVSAIPMWVFFEGSSYGYELRALNELDRFDRAEPET